LLDFSNNSLWLNALIFAVAAACVRFAGSKLAEYADVIAERTGLGRAFVGLLLLAGVTSLKAYAAAMESDESTTTRGNRAGRRAEAAAGRRDRAA
jgi:cation:H+ antiporter